MKWKLEQVTRTDIEGLNIWLAENDGWEPISIQRIEERGVVGWSLVSRKLDEEGEWNFLASRLHPSSGGNPH